MNILFHGWEFPPNGTGVGTYVAAMGRALACQGHRVVIATGRADGCPETETGPWGTVHRFYDRAELRTAAVARRVLELARAERADWIECADHLGEGAPLMAMGPRPPVVLKVHNCNAIRVVREAEIWRPWQRVTIALALARHRGQLRAEQDSLRRADCVLVPSARLRAELVKQGLLAPEKADVVPNPSAPAGEGRQEARVPTLLFAGRICIGKGIGFLPSFLQALLPRFPNLALEIAGPDSYARGLGSMQRWLVGQLGPLADHVRFLGVLGPADLDAAYRRAWVLVLPSRWDNFPNSMLEAMVRGVPVVASPHGGMPEMLAGTGCPVADPATPDFAEKTAELLADCTVRCRMGQAARARALTEYDPARIARGYVAAVIRGLRL
jgi:glycosyltransferase involved in cell wall biosynthesis